MDGFHHYSFSHSTSEDEPSGPFPASKNVSTHFTIDPMAGWPAVLKEFAAFMAGVYGYSIANQVYIEKHDGDLLSLDDIQ